jgi:hypothetical protein
MSKEYCNLEPDDCKKLGKVKADDDGYICCNCGKRVSKWIPVCNVIEDTEGENNG